jgi:hypothetical protein
LQHVNFFQRWDPGNNSSTASNVHSIGKVFTQFWWFHTTSIISQQDQQTGLHCLF